VDGDQGVAPSAKQTVEGEEADEGNEDGIRLVWNQLKEMDSGGWEEQMAQLQLLSSWLGFVKVAASLTEGARAVAQSLWMSKRRESKVQANINKQQMQQQELMKGLDVLQRCLESNKALLTVGERLWAVLVAGTAWRASPPPDFCQQLAAQFVNRLLIPSALNTVSYNNLKICLEGSATRILLLQDNYFTFSKSPYCCVLSLGICLCDDCD
jgi:hypothetical protein